MNVSIFPKIYDDELVYSCLARYHCYSGNQTYIHSAEELFLNKLRHPNIEFYNALKPEVLNLFGDTQELILNHTLFKHYGRFVSSERKQKAMDTLLSGEGNFTDYLYKPIYRGNKVVRYLRYCPVCVKDDRNSIGETYWRCSHQLYGATICVKHNCYLENSNIELTSSSSPGFYCAEIEIPSSTESTKCINELEIRINKYVVDLFNQELDLEQNRDISKFFKEKLSKTKYTSDRGETIWISKLAEDYFAKMPKENLDYIKHKWQLSKVIQGKRLNSVEISLLAIFLDIVTNELAQMQYSNKTPQELFDEELFRLHNEEKLNFAEISRRTGWDYDYIKTIVYKHKNGKIFGRNKGINKGGIDGRDYKSLDKKYLPLVKKIIDDILKDDTSKPTKISVAGIEKTTGLSEGTIKKMPKCHKYIKEHIESIEEYWVRCLIWNYGQIILSDGNLSISKLIKNIKIKKEDVFRLYPYLDGYEPIDISCHIQEIIEDAYSIK